MQVVNSKESMDDDDDLAGCDCSWPGLQTCERRRTAPVCHLSPRTPPVYSHKYLRFDGSNLLSPKREPKLNKQQYGGN